jgi:AraC family transcriptional regulator, regulatory protein of adaptative response / methylated-DNA-[protein]-cysteine methyltransferase
MNKDTHWLEQARALLSEQVVSLDALAKQFNVSPAHLQKRFKQTFGLSPAEYSKQHRLTKFKAALRTQSDVTSAIYEVGFGSPSRVYENGADKLGMPPAVYGKGGQGMQISYSIITTALGECLVAATERGVCAVYLGSAHSSLRKMLNEEFPAAAIQEVKDGRDEFLAPKVKAVANALTGKGAAIKIELIGSAFQHKVWQALMRTSAGETLSYSELAERVGQPSATRAVASACGKNKVAVLVPCHRIVRSDGSLGGYRWGLPFKEKILQHESA